MNYFYKYRCVQNQMNRSFDFDADICQPFAGPDTIILRISLE